MAGSKPKSESFKERSAETKRRCVAVSDEYGMENTHLAASSDGEAMAFKFGAVVRHERKSILADAPENIAAAAADLCAGIGTLVKKSSDKIKEGSKPKVITKVKEKSESTKQSETLTKEDNAQEKKVFGEVLRKKEKTGENVNGSEVLDKIRDTVLKSKKTIGIAAVCVLVLVSALCIGSGFTFAYEANIGGKTVTVDSPEKLESIVGSLNEHLSASFGEKVKLFDANSIALKKKVIKKGSLMPEDEVRQTLINSSDEMYDMYVVYAGETALLGVASEDEANNIINEFKNCYTGGDDSVEITFDKDIHYVYESAPAALLMSDVNAAVLKLNGGEKKENMYVAAQGDTAWSIAQKFETSVDNILALNNLSENDIINIGDELIVEAFVPVVNVTTRQTVTKTVDIPYETEVVKDGSQYNTWSEITVKGANGKKDVEMQIVKVNGNVTEENEISSNVTQQPVTQIKTVGTKEPPKGVGTGSFITPARGYISSRYGSRGRGFHTGLDIAGSYGSAVVAADDGKVIFAGRSGGYGNLVKIDHQNGYVTYYAHNSSFAVKPGQTVTKGQTIAYMGSTGNSTGNHCHFEIFKNGSRLNPENYI